MGKTIYAGMCADILHQGHINIISKASQYGEVIIGLFTDKAIASYKRVPFLSYEQRKAVLQNIKGVKEVIPQDTLDYDFNLKQLKPDYVIHGDDWKTGKLKSVRENVINTIKEWGGELIEVPYTEGISSTLLTNNIKPVSKPSDQRIKSLQHLLELKPCIRIMEVHSPLSGIIVENTRVKVQGIMHDYDGMWSSSLTNSAILGKPDIEVISISERLNLIRSIFDVTTKPLIFDCDTGGRPEHFQFSIRSLISIGVSGVIIEDKIGFKRNSLLEQNDNQIQDTVAGFSHKINLGKQAARSDYFMLIARIESLILNKGIKDALIRANEYINAGADGIMIHSRMKEKSEIADFCKEYDKFKHKVPLVCAPTTFNTVHESELSAMGVNIIIYANQLLRASYPAMQKVAEQILIHGRSQESEYKLIPVDKLQEAMPFSTF